MGLQWSEEAPTMLAIARVHGIVDHPVLIELVIPDLELNLKEFANP